MTKLRTSTGVRFPPDVHAALVEAAEDRDVSVNWLVNKAVVDFLERLLPVEEIRWTRDALVGGQITPPMPGTCPRCGSVFRLVRRLVAGIDDVPYPCDDRWHVSASALIAPPVAEAPKGAPEMFKRG